ncbi:ATP-binding cassette sub-family A [Aureococcus anophagefferens]|nr:ATP-binding cassette sub-family A [Aureococcus anophagefferens]
MSPACAENENEDGWMMVEAPAVPPLSAPEEKWVVTAAGTHCRDRYVTCLEGKENGDGDANNGAGPNHVDDDCKSALCGSEASHGTKSTTSAGEIKARAAKKPVVNKKKKEKNAQKNNKKKKRLAPFCGRTLYPEGGARDDAVLRALGLARDADRVATELSGGGKRKLSVAVALCGGSRFVVLDEPSAGLDALARRALWDALRRAKAGRCVLLTTHHLDEAAVLGDAIGIARRRFVAKAAAELRRTYGSGYEVVARKTARFDDGGWRAVVGDGAAAPTFDAAFAARRRARASRRSSGAPRPGPASTAAPCPSRPSRRPTSSRPATGGPGAPGEARRRGSMAAAPASFALRAAAVARKRLRQTTRAPTASSSRRPRPSRRFAAVGVAGAVTAGAVGAPSARPSNFLVSAANDVPTDSSYAPPLGAVLAATVAQALSSSASPLARSAPRRRRAPVRPKLADGAVAAEAAAVAATAPGARPLVVDGLGHAYGGGPDVLRGVSFRVAAGECFGLLGCNGAGKSTIISSALGFLAPRAGAVALDGRSVGGVDAERRHAAAAGVALALVGDPRVVLLDEPSNGLDPRARRDLWNVVRATRARRAVVLTTHDMGEVEALCDRAAVLVAGAFEALGTVAGLKDALGDTYDVTATSIGLAARRRAGRRLVKPAVPAFSFAANRALSTKEEAPSSGPPQTYADYSHDALLMLSVAGGAPAPAGRATPFSGAGKRTRRARAGDDDAVVERMVRDIMLVDGVSYADANEAAATKGLWLTRFPYRVGIASALIAGFGSIPMCFDLHTTLWFNEGYVTTDVPEAKDLETWLEVGSWSWNWMEPPLGQASFFLLCLQYSRDQMKNIGMKPYTEWLKERRAAKLVDQFPTYNKIIVADFSRSLMMR